jgi:hypothetical protein
MDAEKLATFKANANSVRIGDDIVTVVQLLGKPDSDKTIGKNERLRLLEYYVTRQRADVALDTDLSVIVIFSGADGEKVRRVCSNVDGIASKNCPADNPSRILK